MCRCFSRTCLLFNAKLSLQKRDGNSLYSPGFLEKEDWIAEPCVHVAQCVGTRVPAWVWRSLQQLGKHWSSRVCCLQYGRQKKIQKQKLQNQILIFGLLARLQDLGHSVQVPADGRLRPIRPRSMKKTVRKSY